MDPRFAAAAAAFRAKRLDEGAVVMAAAIDDAGDQAPAAAFRYLATELFAAGRHAEARGWCERGLALHPDDGHLWNVLAVARRRLGDLAEALQALDQAERLDPESEAVLVNRVNVLNDMGDGERAVPAAQALLRQGPGKAEYHRMAALAHRHRGETGEAERLLEEAVRIDPRLLAAWTDRVSLAMSLQDYEAALRIVDRALAVHPALAQLLESKAIILRRAGRLAEAEKFLEGILAADDAAAWAHHQLGRALMREAPGRAQDRLRRAVELAPSVEAYRLSLIQSLERSGPAEEAAGLEAAYQAAKALGPVPADSAFVARDVFVRVGDYDRAARLGGFDELGRAWARTGAHGALATHLPRAQAPEDRHALIAHHRLWGRRAQAEADRTPIAHPPERPPDGRIRLGLMSSDLRYHPVGYFVQPLFDFPDRRFDLYCYAFNTGEEGQAQRYFASRAKAFRWRPGIGDREAAQMIADDQLDVLIELGGSTHMNKLEVMAYRPAPITASWLGYPHSAGLETIDYIVVDPYLTPPDPALLIEKPLLMPHSWLSLGRGQFREEPAVAPQMPYERNGFVTFGTANHPNKYSPSVLATWARVMAAVPDSRFLIVRPEAGAPSFRENLTAAFAAEGVSAERLRFEAVRGAHLPYYNEIDISLDTFPLTGGTTTCESLWMGVPVVSLIGEALFERLSYSILSNAGLGDLAADSPEAYVATAVKLAGDHERRKALRAGLRDQLKASPLGQTQAFAKDFYDMVAATVAAAH